MRSFAILVAMFTVTVGSEMHMKATGLRNFEDEERNFENAIQIVESEERMIVEEGQYFSSITTYTDELERISMLD